jgi:hypothetical protein
MSDAMFRVAAECLAGQLSSEERGGRRYETCAAWRGGSRRRLGDAAIGAAVAAAQWEPRYLPPAAT